MAHIHCNCHACWGPYESCVSYHDGLWVCNDAMPNKLLRGATEEMPLELHFYRATLGSRQCNKYRLEKTGYGKYHKMAVMMKVVFVYYEKVDEAHQLQRVCTVAFFGNTSLLSYWPFPTWPSPTWHFPATCVLCPRVDLFVSATEWPDRV